jgi:tetratricopeptide (TPR) repeat protein
MKKAIALLIVIVFSLLYYMGFLTKRETLPLSKEFFSIETASSVEGMGDFREKLLKTKSREGKPSSISTKDLDLLYQLKLDRGIKNLPLLSQFLIREAERVRGEGDAGQAVQIASYSVQFSPDLPQPYFGLSRALWHKNPFQIHKILLEIFRGVIAQFRYYPSFIKLIYDLFYILCHAILMTFIIYGIVVLVKYLPLYFYQIRKDFNKEMTKLLINSLRIFSLLIPFFLRLDMLWAILYWTILIWGYVTKKQQQFILAFFIVLVYIPFFLHFSSTFLDGQSSDVIVEINRGNHEDQNRTTAEKLQAWLLTHPDDPEVLLTLGTMEKREGRYSQAEEFYQRAIQQKPKYSEAFSNLGNVYLAQRKTDLAIDSYQQAIRLSPNKGAYYYNLYRAYAQNSYLSRQTGEALQRAQQLDAEIVKYYTTIDSPNMNRLVIDEVLTPQQLRGRFLTQFVGREGILFPLFKAWFEKIPSRVPFLMPIFFLGLLIGISRYSRAKRFLTRCPMCGSPTHRFYLGTSEKDFICFNCHRIFIQKEKIHPKIAEKKSLQVRQFQRQNHFIGRFLSFFFIGFGYLWREHMIRGLILLFLFFVFILKLAYWNGVIPSSIAQPVTFQWGTIIWGGLFLFFYVYSLRKVLRLKPRFKAEE